MVLFQSGHFSYCIFKIARMRSILRMQKLQRENKYRNCTKQIAFKIVLLARVNNHCYRGCQVKRNFPTFYLTGRNCSVHTRRIGSRRHYLIRPDLFGKKHLLHSKIDNDIYSWLGPHRELKPSKRPILSLGLWPVGRIGLFFRI